MVHLNWSHFKPEFSGKPDKDEEAHLLHTNDWMNAHHFCLRCQSPKILSNTIRRSQIMVSFIRAYWCIIILAHLIFSPWYHTQFSPSWHAFWPISKTFTLINIFNIILYLFQNFIFSFFWKSVLWSLGVVFTHYYVVNKLTSLWSPWSQSNTSV